MAIMTLFPRIINAGTANEGKAFDNPGYENALKESGWTAEEAQQYWSDVNNTDPYAKAGKDISEALAAQAPKVSIKDGQINISAPQAVLDSPLVSQIEQQLQTLKGSDLSSPEVTNAIDALNKEVQQSLNDWMVEETFGWTPEEFADYQRAIQIVNVPNPLNSKETLKAKRPGGGFYTYPEGHEKAGIVMELTPQEWINYWREIFNTDQRTDMFINSLQSDDPYERVMALIMSKGSQNPIYGYDPGERIGQGLEAFRKEMSKFPYGIFRLVSTSNDVRRVEDFEKKLGLKTKDFINLYTPKTEEEFERVKEEIKGKTWKELSDVQKAFLVELGVSKENRSLRPVDRDLKIGDQRYRSEDLKNMSAENDSVSRAAIENIILNNSFERFKQVSDDYNKMQASDAANLTDAEEKLAKNAIWSSAEQNIGTFAGVLGRFLWENAVGKALTGKSMNKISDTIAGSATEGTGLLGWLAKHNISPTSAAGAGAMKFAAQLIGTVPEDLLQTSVDNIVTYNADENANLLNPDQMSENFKNNLIFMSLFNAARAGWSAVKKAKLIRQLAKQADLDVTIDIGVAGSETTDIAKAYEEGGRVETDGQKAYKVNADGTREELKNTTPEQAEMVKKVVEGEARSTTTSEQPYKNGTDTGFYSFVEANSPIDGVRNNFGSLTEWLSAKDVDIENRAAESRRRFESLPQEIKDVINNDKNIQRMLSNYEHDVAFRRLGADFPLSKTSLDGSYANYLWKQASSNGINGKVTGAGNEADITLKSPEFDDAAKAVDRTPSVASNDGGAVDDAARAADNGDSSTVKVEVDTPDGVKEVETRDYNFKSDSPEDVLDAKVKIEPTKAGVTHWGNKALKAMMRNAQTKLFNEFRSRFGNDITTADFDWVLYNTRKGLTPEQIIGTTIPGTNRLVTKNTIDALRWWGDNPAVKVPRMLSLKALGKGAEDFNYLGYLPHTSYDPWVVPFEEGKAGQLWQQYTGKSMVNDNGEYVGYGGTLEGRYRTFLSNMLWDIKNKEIQAARLVEEAALDGKQLSPESAMKMAEGWNKIQDGITNPKKSKSMNNLEKGALADGDDGKNYFEEANETFKKEASESGLSKSMNKNFAEMYIGSGRGNVEQPQGLGKSTFAVGTQGDTMRKIKVNGVSMYDAGGADITYAAQNAFEFVTRWMNEGADPSKFRSNLVEYLKTHSKRSAKYAEPVADRIIARIAKENRGGTTKGGVIKTLTKSFRSEGFNRLRRWTVLADYSQFDKGTIQFMDSFWYKHMQMEALTNNKAIIDKIADSIKNVPDKLTEARYNALFYGNFKNALLQVSELNRLFTVFKLGDVGTMLRKMATDADFRAKVDMYVNAVAPKTTYLEAGLYEKYGNLNDSIEVGETETRFGTIKDAKKTINDIALAPINAAEDLKNKTMVAALVAEADRLGYTGDTALMYIRQRFERVALAQNEMGKIGLSTNPFAKPFLFLQNFQIRELGMNYYNIVDPIDLKTGKAMKSGKVLNAAKYLMKVFGAKLGTTLLLSRLGYSAAQTMGLDPLGLVGNYDRLDDSEKTWWDEQISGGILTPFFAGGMTSLFADMYFMAREAYEDANRETIEDEVGANLNENQNPLDRMDWGAIFNLNNLRDQAANFMPGNVFGNRIGQMNEMLDTGWALSANGNQMYTAPNDAVNTALGYLFGRSATQNAQQYRQTYGSDIGQTLGRIFRGFTGQGTTFDPIDTKNYSDWFDGSANDLQQFEKGKRWFIDERDRILDAYQNELQKGYKYGDVYESEAKANMTKRLDDLFEKLGRFVNAYEKENGTISGKMVKELIGVLNVERESVNDSQSTADESGQNEYSKAMERYAQLGLPTTGYYSGPSRDYPGTSTDESKTEVKYKGSPQWQVSSTSKYNLQTEAAAVLRAADAVLQEYRKKLKDLYGEAVQSNNYTEFNKAQPEYLKAFDSVVGPIVATYGTGVLNSDDVKAQLEKMLSTSSNSGKNIGNLIPYKQYATDKYGRVRTIPNESVNVVKWALERYNSDTFKHPTIRSYSSAQEDMDAIKRLIADGQQDMARARALSLKVRIDNQKRSLNNPDYQWLLNFLNNGGTR